MTTARDIMTNETRCVGENPTLADAARMMRHLGVGSLPVCGDDDRLQGMITDRDIVIKCVADGQDPTRVHPSELAHGKPVTVGAADDIDVVRRSMTDHEIRRLPVIDGHDPSASSAKATSPATSPTTASAHSSHPSPTEPAVAHTTLGRAAQPSSATSSRGSLDRDGLP